MRKPTVSSLRLLVFSSIGSFQMDRVKYLTTKVEARNCKTSVKYFTTKVEARNCKTDRRSLKLVPDTVAVGVTCECGARRSTIRCARAAVSRSLGHWL